MALFNKLTGAAVVLSALASAVPTPQGSTTSNTESQPFYLKPEITAGNGAIFPPDLYLTTFHTGAGTSAVVADNNKTIAAIFSLNETYLGLAGGAGTPPVPYTFGLYPYNAYLSNAPNTYNVVTVDAGLDTAGFSLDDNNVVQYAGDVQFEGFSLCSVNGTAPYFSVGPDYQLFWRNATSVKDADNCAYVDLTACYTSLEQ